MSGGETEVFTVLLMSRQVYGAEKYIESVGQSHRLAHLGWLPLINMSGLWS